MEPRLTLELLGTADICLRVGRNLCGRYKHIQGTKRDVDDLNARVENVWRDIESQLGTVHGSPEAVPVILREQMVDVLHRLQFRLHTASKNFEKTTDKKGWSVTRMIWFTFFLKRLLKRDVSGLEKWRDMFTAIFSVLCVVQDNPEPDRILSDEATEVLRPDGSAAGAVHR